MRIKDKPHRPYRRAIGRLPFSVDFDFLARLLPASFVVSSKATNNPVSVSPSSSSTSSPSVSSSSSSFSTSYSSVSHSRRPRYSTSAAAIQIAVADRIVRAMRHQLFLLHRSESNFFVLGSTANVYIVTLSLTPACTCPDRLTPCKHILFVLIRVLGLSPDDPALKRRTIRPCLLAVLLSSPTLLNSLADPALRKSTTQQGQEDDSFKIEEGTTCPVCLEELEATVEATNQNRDKAKVVVRCGTCKNALHEECLIQWKRNSGRRSASCVLCRARWKELTKHTSQNQYLNLSAYMGEDDCSSTNRARGSTTGRFLGAG